MNRSNKIYSGRRNWRSAMTMLFLVSMTFGTCGSALAQTEQGQMNYKLMERLKLPVQQMQQMQIQQPKQQAQSSKMSAPGSVSAHSGVTAYLRIEGVGGPSTHANYRGWVILDGFEEDLISNQSQAGRAAVKPFSVTKPIDSTSVPLRKFAMSGNTIPRLELAVITQGGQYSKELYRTLLERVTVQRVDTIMQNGTVLEKVVFFFTRIHWHFNMFDHKGSKMGTLGGCWDVSSNRGC